MTLVRLEWVCERLFIVLRASIDAIAVIFVPSGSGRLIG
jgi:hypothetical protein